MSSYVCKWTIKEIQDFLERSGLEQYQETFLKNGIDGDILTEMDEFDLTLLSIEDKDKDLILSIMKKSKISLNEFKREECVILPIPTQRADNLLYHSEPSCLTNSPGSTNINEKTSSDPLSLKDPTRKSRSGSLVIFQRTNSNSPGLLPKKNRSHISIPVPRIQIDSDEKISEWDEKMVCISLT